MKRKMKLASLLILSGPMLFASSCLLGRTDIQDAIAAPITDAISGVVGALLTNLLTGAGLL